MLLRFSWLAGFNEIHLGLGTQTPYDVGTRIFLVDEPYSRKTGVHCISGQYEIVAMNDKLPKDAEPIHVVDKNIIVYKEAHPENGPWLNGPVVRNIRGTDYTVHQIADDFNFFPYRFGIRHVDYRNDREVNHRAVNCWLCGR